MMSRPDNAIKLIYAAILGSFAIWALAIGVYQLKSQSPSTIDPAAAWNVHGLLVGQNFVPSGLEEKALPAENSTWKGKLSVIREGQNHTLELTTPLFRSPTTLYYNGTSWVGFTQLPGRTLPVHVDARQF